jgi:tetratricopeptide (TPR) repeat protein
MATDKSRKLEAKNQKLIVVIICFVGVFIFPFVSDCQISFPGFEYTPSISLQIVDKDGKPVPDAYILYEYRGSTPRFPEGSDIYIKNPTIAITDTNGQFKIRGLFQTKPLGRERAEFEFFGAYSPVTHSAFGVDASRSHQKITLGDNTNDLKRWEKDLEALEKGYGWLMFMVNDSEPNKNLVVTNKEKFEAMIQSERRLLNERKGNDDVTLNGFKTTFEYEVLRDMLPLATHLKINEKIHSGDLDGAIAVYTTVIEQKPGFFYAYVGRGELKMEKGDLDGALDDYNMVIKVQPMYILARLWRGELKKEMGDFDGALADYNMVIKLKPENAPAYEGRGFVKLAQGDLIGAQADFKKAIELDSTILAPILTNGNSMSTKNSK